MAVNRFDQPAQAQFINTYVPVPFQEILQAGLTKQGMYNTGKSALDQQVAESELFKYIPNSEDENYIRGVQESMRSISDRYASQDFSNPEVIRSIQRDVRKASDRDLISRIQQSRQGYDKYNELANQLRMRGEYADDLGYDFTGYNSRSGIFSGSPEAALDYRQKKESYFNNLRGNKYADRTTGELREYIDDRQINALAKAGASDYAKSNYGVQEIKRYRNRTGDRETSDEQLAYRFLQETGQEKKYNELAGFLPQYMMKGQNQQDANRNFIIRTGEGESTGFSIPEAQQLLKDYDAAIVELNKPSGRSSVYSRDIPFKGALADAERNRAYNKVMSKFKGPMLDELMQDYGMSEKEAVRTIALEKARRPDTFPSYFRPTAEKSVNGILNDLNISTRNIDFKSVDVYDGSGNKKSYTRDSKQEAIKDALASNKIKYIELNLKTGDILLYPNDSHQYYGIPSSALNNKGVAQNIRNYKQLFDVLYSPTSAKSNEVYIGDNIFRAEKTFVPKTQDSPAHYNSTLYVVKDGQDYPISESQFNELFYTEMFGTYGTPGQYKPEYLNAD